MPFMRTTIRNSINKQEVIGTQRIEEEMPIEDDSLFEWPDFYLPVGETEPAVVDVEEFQYAYKCKHCGHEWVEKHEEVDRERLIFVFIP